MATRKSLDELQALLARMTEDLAARGAQVDGMKSSAASRSDLEELRTQIGAERRELDELKALAGNSRTDLDRLDASLAARRMETEGLQALVESLKTSSVPRADGDAIRALLSSLKAQMDAIQSILTATRAEFSRAELVLDAAHSRCDIDGPLREAFETYRATDAYRQIHRKDSPLVSVCVATYNRADLLVSRCLRSILLQDYPNFEVVVIGDGCTDETGAAVAKLGDSRVRFENLPQRGDYPSDPGERWMVGGTAAANRAEQLARGDLLTHLDDDDEYTPDRLSKLVTFLQQTRSDVVWHPFMWETSPGNWVQNPAEEFRHAQVTAGSTLFLSWFRNLPWDSHAYRYQEPGDWNRFRKFKYLGSRLRRFPEPLLRHYRERNQQPPG